MENNDLISRSELIDEIEGYLLMCGSGSVGAVHDVLDAIREAKAVDAIPVRHGRWAHLGGDEWCCTQCGDVIHTEGSWEKPTKKYCNECGAKMDEED